MQCTRGGFRRKRDADAYAVEIESTRQQGVVIPHSFGGVPLGEVADTAMLAVAAGEVDEAWFAGWLRDRVTFLGDQQPGGTGLS